MNNYPISETDPVEQRIAGLEAAANGEVFAHRFTITTMPEDQTETRVIIDRVGHVELVDVEQDGSNGVKINYDGLMTPSACKAAALALKIELYSNSR